jgi:hypothetical protein
MIDKGKEDLIDSFKTQIYLSRELARIAINCPTCRELFGNIVKNRTRKIRSPSDLPSQEENQTSVNPNNDLGDGNVVSSNGDAVSNADRR